MMKNIEYLLKKEYELKHIKETTPLCKICYKSKYKINCSNACHSCEFNKFVDVLNFLNRDYYQEYEISQYDYDVLDCVRSTNLIYKKSRFKDFEMLVRMKEKGHFKNINKNVLIKDLLKRLVIKDIDYDVKQQRIKQKNEDDEMTAEEMFEKLSYREVKNNI